MSDPTFYTDGNTPRRDATELIVAQKILGAILDGGGGGGGGGGSGLSGTGSPEGVTTANPGATYIDTSTSNFWVKQTGTGNIGWIELVGS